MTQTRMQITWRLQAEAEDWLRGRENYSWNYRVRIVGLEAHVEAIKNLEPESPANDPNSFWVTIKVVKA